MSEVEGMKNALAVVGDLKARATEPGLVGDAFREAYSLVERRLLECIRLAERSDTSGEETGSK